MPKMIQIRNVPDEIHTELKVRAARAGMTLSDYLLSELERIVSRHPAAEVLRRDQLSLIDVDPDEVVELIRSDRDRS